MKKCIVENGWHIPCFLPTTTALFIMGFNICFNLMMKVNTGKESVMT